MRHVVRPEVFHGGQDDKCYVDSLETITATLYVLSLYEPKSAKPQFVSFEQAV